MSTDCFARFRGIFIVIRKSGEKKKGNRYDPPRCGPAGRKFRSYATNESPCGTYGFRIRAESERQGAAAGELRAANYEK